MYIIFLNINILYDSIYTFSFIIPLSRIKTKPYNNYFNRNLSYSINRITYLEDKTILENLMQDKIYVVTFEFICSFTTYNEDAPTINLSKPIIITKNSNHQTISKFIYSRIDECVNTFYLEDSLIFNKNKEDGPGVIVKYQEINIF